MIDIMKADVYSAYYLHIFDIKVGWHSIVLKGGTVILICNNDMIQFSSR